MNKPEIAIIDYGMGNLRSVAKALELVGARVIVTDESKKIMQADAIVLPGVGSFGPAMKSLQDKNLDKTILNVIDLNKPFLGVCLGFQLLFEIGMEDGRYKGLGIIKGEVLRFKIDKDLKVPHMGWNKVRIAGKEAEKTMFKDIKNDSYFYFVHSYFGLPEQQQVIAGESEYGIKFCSAIIDKKAWACQFHPEKSGETGLILLRNFVNEVKKC